MNPDPRGLTGETPGGLSALYAELLSGSLEGILAVGPDKKVLYASDTMAGLLSRSPAETRGHSLWDVLRNREIGEMVENALGQRRADTREITFPLDPPAIFRVHIRPLTGAVRGAGLFFQDVSSLRRLENVRKDFVANVSHELRTPLTSLRAALETLLEGAWEDKVHAKEFLETASHQVDRLQRLIDDLLTLSRIEKHGTVPGEAAAGSLSEVASRVIKALEPLAKKETVTLRSELPGEPALAAATADELTQILMNLVDNAIKFNRPGGSVTVSVRPAGERWQLTVTDTGVGIPADQRARIFERFYRVDKARSSEKGGTGLGLSIVKHILENRRGAIVVDSETGVGTVFAVTLPRAG